jgi:hypothetical protein
MPALSNTGATAMAKPDFAGQPTIQPTAQADTFTFQVGRIFGILTVDQPFPDAETFTIMEAAVQLPNGDIQSLPHPDHFIDVPIPPPVLDFFVI